MDLAPGSVLGWLYELRSETAMYKIAATVALVAAIYGAHVLLRYYIGHAVTRDESRLKYLRHSRTTWTLLAIALVLGVWIEELKTVTLVLAGVVAAILITGKEVFLGLAGRVSLTISDHYDIGDRIHINGVHGDVINVGLLYTWLLEVDARHGENQATGRVVLVPHVWLTQHAVTNSTLGHEYIWDEIEIGFPVTVDVARVFRILTDRAAQVLRDEIREAELQVPLIGKRYAAKSPPVTPVSYVRNVMEPSGHQYLVVSVRFSVKARTRRAISSDLTVNLFDALREHNVPVYQNFPYKSPTEPAA